MLFRKNNKNFHVDIKGLVFNEAGKLMLIQEPDGKWELPGGRMEHGETFEQALKRECQEEMGVNCTVLDTIPYFAWPHHWVKQNIHLVYLAFRIKLDSFDFKESNECVGHDFFTISELDTIDLYYALHPLKEWLKKQKNN